jgi:hypothetical protein
MANGALSMTQHGPLLMELLLGVQTGSRLSIGDHLVIYSRPIGITAALLVHVLF